MLTEAQVEQLNNLLTTKAAIVQSITANKKRFAELEQATADIIKERKRLTEGYDVVAREIGIVLGIRTLTQTEFSAMLALPDAPSGSSVAS